MSATITVIDRATVVRIREEHEACERAGHEWVAHAIECGRLLAEVKAQLRHGEWGPWIEEHFPASQRTAQTYMQLAAQPEDKRNSVADLPLRQARDAIAEPKPKPPTPAATADQLRQLGGGGRSPEIERRLAEARAAREQEATWTDQERRKLDRVVESLDDLTTELTVLKSDGKLGRQAIGDGLRTAGVRVRQVASVLDDLAFSFER